MEENNVVLPFVTDPTDIIIRLGINAFNLSQVPVEQLRGVVVKDANDNDVPIVHALVAIITMLAETGEKISKNNT